MMQKRSRLLYFLKYGRALVHDAYISCRTAGGGGE